MVFSSTLFLLFFLPIFLLLYYLIPYRFRNLFIILGGYFFYSWGSPRFALILVFTISLDYFLSHLIYKKNKSGRKNQAKYILALSIFTNIGLLGFFKYSNFLIEQVNFVLGVFTFEAMPWREVILPIGISFIVFQQLSYVIDVYRGRVRPAESIINYAAYMMLFPQIIAGPIVRYIDIAKQLVDRRHSPEMFFEGVRRFSIGLAKKVIIANSMSGLADAVFYLHSIREISSPMAWLGILAYGMQIYFDFSGYSDMAIGLAKMMGFTFLENFRMPYIATSITDFWRRWHISLSTWMREYLYFPLGGNRISPLRTYINLWIVFLISGFWHGASWSFVVWGAFHGFFLVLDKLFWLKLSNRMPKFFNIAITFTIVMVGWSFFRIENIVSASQYVVSMFSINTWFTPVAIRWTEVLDYRLISILLLALFISFFPSTKIYSKISLLLNSMNKSKFTIFQAVYSLVFLLISLMSLVNAQFNPFIYFRF